MNLYDITAEYTKVRKAEIEQLTEELKTITRTLTPEEIYEIVDFYIDTDIDIIDDAIKQHKRTYTKYNKLAIREEQRQYSDTRIIRDGMKKIIDELTCINHVRDHLTYNK